MKALKKILVVDDEKKILEVIASFLTHKGYQVRIAETGEKALKIFEQETISFVILDLMLPDLSGEEVCRRLRKCSRVPIIMLTAKTLEDDMIKGLQIGADDYITKPFSLKELYARIEVIFRRTSNDLVPLTNQFSWNQGDLYMNFEHMEIKKNGAEVSLTPKEWRILSALVKYPQKAFSREELISIAFDHEFDGYDRVVDTHIKNLRMKLEDNPKQPVYIKTVHGKGYKFGGGRS